MTAERFGGPMDILNAIDFALVEMRGIQEAGIEGLTRLAPLLEVRDLARDGQALARHLNPSGTNARYAVHRFRLGMALLEIQIDTILVGLSQSASEEDLKTLTDSITAILRDLDANESELKKLEDSRPMRPN